MKIGTKSLLVGVHQIFWHPFTVYRAWMRLYGRPTFRESLCIFFHDWGYWGSSEMDGVTGANHPELGAAIAGALFGEVHRELVLLHSRRYAADRGRHPSKLCWADKLSIVYEPDWFYLVRARASGELREYRRQAMAWIPSDKSDHEWLLWVKHCFARAALWESRASSTDISARLENDVAERGSINPDCSPSPEEVRPERAALPATCD
jgi:hypothetical protein